MNSNYPQYEIESAMQSFELLQRWECIQLYSSEGLLMASSGLPMSPPPKLCYTQDQLLEFSLSLIDTARLLKDVPVKEFVIRSKHHRRLVFRFFDSSHDTMVLAAVLHTQKGYRRAMSTLVKAILNVL